MILANRLLPTSYKDRNAFCGWFPQTRYINCFIVDAGDISADRFPQKAVSVVPLSFSALKLRRENYIANTGGTGRDYVRDKQVIIHQIGRIFVRSPIWPV